MKILALLTTFLLVFPGPRCSGEEASGTRLALIVGQGKRKPTHLAVAELKVTLSQEGGLALVERTEIEEILREQKLAASGLSRSASAARLGELLSADLLLFVEKVPETTTPLIRLQVVESRTGAFLGTHLADGRHTKKEMGAALAAIRRSVLKARTPYEKRRYAALLDFRNARRPSRPWASSARRHGLRFRVCSKP